jgi:hypothetical protein
VVHLHLIRETIERWDRNGTAPVDLDEAGVIAALHAGALAPDTGYYPGAQAFIADLSHYLRSGELVRNLMAEAFFPVERAFVWGWVSHVLGDVLLHPAVNRAAAELRDDPGVLSYADDPEAHMQVEVGLDAYFDARYGTPPVRDVLDGETGFVARGYHATYDVKIPRATFNTAFAAGARYQGPIRTVTRLTHTSFAQRGVGPKAAVAGLAAGGLMARAVAGDTPIPGLFRGVEPRGALLAAVEKAMDDYHQHMQRHQDTELAELPDYNLDTGESGETARQYRGAVMTEQQLNKYRGI